MAKPADDSRATPLMLVVAAALLAPDGPRSARPLIRSAFAATARRKTYKGWRPDRESNPGALMQARGRAVNRGPAKLPIRIAWRSLSSAIEASAANECIVQLRQLCEAGLRQGCGAMAVMMQDSEMVAMRHAMVASQLRTNAVSDARVVAAMDSVAREVFLPADAQAIAYRDTAVPLGHGRAQNLPIATGRLLTQAELRASDRVLLVGAAGGYT
eukprot:gene28733-32111_t